MGRPIVLSIIYILLGAPSSHADIPLWAKKDSIKKNGNILWVACDGSGPSVTLARKEAISNCQVSAKQFLDSDVKIKSFSIETEQNMGFHQEIEETNTFHNLTCNPKKDEVVEKDSQFHVWVQCEFNLSKASSKPDEKAEIREKTIQSSGLKSVIAKKRAEISRDSKSVVLESVPQCDSIIVRGIKSRTIPCASNPMSVVLMEGEKEIIVRARDFIPKTIPVSQGGSNETIQVFLERN